MAGDFVFVNVVAMRDAWSSVSIWGPSVGDPLGDCTGSGEIVTASGVGSADFFLSSHDETGRS